MPDVSNRKRRPNGEFDDEDKKPKPATGGVTLPYDETNDGGDGEDGGMPAHWPPDREHEARAQEAFDAIMPMMFKQTKPNGDCFNVDAARKEYLSLPENVQAMNTFESPMGVWDQDPELAAFLNTCHLIQHHPEILDDTGKSVARNILDNPDDRVAVLALDSMDASRGDVLRLSESEDPEVRAQVTGSDIVPKNLLGQMMWNDPDPDVRYAAFHAYGFRPRLDDYDLERILANEPDKRIRKEAFALRYGERRDTGIDEAATIYAEVTGGDNWEKENPRTLSNLIREQLGERTARTYEDYQLRGTDIHGNYVSGSERKQYIHGQIDRAIRSKARQLGVRSDEAEAVFDRWFRDMTAFRFN